MKLFILLGFVLNLAWGQDAQYRMEGSYNVTPDLNIPPANTITTLTGAPLEPIAPPPTSPTIAVDFSAEWRERDGIIQGTYRDDTFVGRATLTGTSAVSGRTMNVYFPQTVRGVNSITILSSISPPSTGATPITVTARNAAGTAISTENEIATITTDAAPAAATNDCDIGFGALSGYCGLYGGTVTESVDTGNRCGLNRTGVRLELANSSQVRIYQDYNGNTVGLPNHNLGSIPSSPLTAAIAMDERNCGSLAGTNFASGNCQTMVINGTFTDLAGTKGFSGTYTITDEVTGDTCTYSLTLNREIGY